MISKLKKKFTFLATVSMFVLMAALIGVMNILNYSSVINECDTTIDVLFRNEDVKEKLPAIEEETKDTDKKPPNGLSPEVVYEARYFILVLDENENIVSSDFSRILTVNEDNAETYKTKAISRKSEKGFVDVFRFEKKAINNETKILFLDCGRKLESFHRFFIISMIVGFSGCLLVFVLFVFLSGRIVRPIAESYEKQKRFISDASHEMKTPLTIINANLDLLEGEDWNEELEEIRMQTKRMTQFTHDLVFLSKMEEKEHDLMKIEAPLSDLVNETASTFSSIAKSREIDFEKQIEEEVTYTFSIDAIRELLEILLENAMKYTPKNGRVLLSLSKEKKQILLRIENTSNTKIDKESLRHVFERFYRLDASRNSSTGGHGIGLSIAKAIVEKHNGNIQALSKTGDEFIIEVTLPL